MSFVEIACHGGILVSKRILELLLRSGARSAEPGEFTQRAFINGMRFYEDGQYERAEVMLRRALSEGLRDRNDVAVANKHLAFIACAYDRPAECESAFRAAFAADPTFKLTDAEVGHPLWGPVYKRVAAEQVKGANKS